MSKRTIKDALDRAIEYFDERADAEYFTDSPRPIANEEMSLMVECQEALRCLERLI